MDKVSLDWILSPKDDVDPSTALFNDFVKERHVAFAKTGGLTGLRALNATSSGWSEVNTSYDIEVNMI